MPNIEKNTPKIIITIAPMGGGKSTWALEFIKKNPTYVIVSRDTIRFANFGAAVVDYKAESIISKIIDEQVKMFNKAGYNVIIDQTTLKMRYVNDFINKYQPIADVSFKVFDVDLETCLRQNKMRIAEKIVPEPVVKEAYQSFLVMKDTNAVYQTYFKLTHTNGVYENTDNLPLAVGFDLDGTLAHMDGGRSPYQEELADQDRLDKAVFATYQVYKKAGYKIILCSGRQDTYRDVTERWLKANNIEFDLLVMRKGQDTRKDNIVKQELFFDNIYENYFLEMMFDDRDSVVKMWREIGVKCAQVEYGNF